MPEALLPDNEAERLRSLTALNVLDSPAEREFDALVHAAALICGVPISLISLIDSERQWFKANVGLPGVTETPRELAFCAHAIRDDGILEVQDATLDARFSDNALVTGNPDIRFYAGATLRLSDGSRVGTLCVIDRQPRQLDATQRELLRLLAAAAVQALEGRRALQTERAMLEVASQAAAVLRNSIDCIVVLQLDGTVTHWNTAADRLFGYSAAAMVGQPIDRLIPAGLSGEEDVADKLRAHPEGTTYLSSRRTRLGELVAVSISVAPVTDTDGIVIGATQIIRDIRDQVRSAQILAESEARFRALSDSSPLGVFATNVAGACTYTNASWQQIYGISLAESLGDGWSSALHPDDRESVFVEWQRTAAERIEFDKEFRIRHASGDIRHVHARAQALIESGEVVVGYVGSVQDVTQRVRAEQALQEERVRLASILDATGAGTWEWNVQTGETRFNTYWANIVGLTVEELGATTIQTWLDLAHPDDLARSGALLEAHFAGATPTYDCEARMRHRDGHWVWVLDRGRVLTWTADGKPQWMFGTHLDITTRKQQEAALLRSEQLLNETGAVAGVGGWELDLVSGDLRWSAETRRIHGVADDYRPTLAAALDFYAPEARPVIQDAVETAIRTGGAWDLELPLDAVGGRRIWVRAVGHAEREGDTPIRLIGAFQDVTKVRQLRADLHAQHELLRVTLRSIGDAVVTTTAGGEVTWLNPVAERMTGWLNADACGKALAQVYSVIDAATGQAFERPSDDEIRTGQWLDEADQLTLTARDGAEYGIEESSSLIQSDHGELLGRVLVVRDVTAQRRMTSEMRYRATHDLLTGLVNRAEFETRLGRTLEKAKRDSQKHALLFIDLDQFKLVNDACGHAGGDQLLRQVARLLNEAIRSRDTLARLGGDEFAIILEHCELHQAERVAEKICEQMEDFRFIHDGRRFRIGTSIGVVPVDGRWDSTDTMLRAADTSCYAAKEAGRNRVHVWFDSDQAARARQGEMHWAERIGQALDDGRFVLYAQHIRSLHNMPTGLHAEILLRLVDCDGAIVSPGAFLPAAERFHLASRIDRWVLQHTLDQLAGLRDLAAVETLCVNLSGQSIGDRTFHSQTLEMLERAGPEICRRLCLEITETAAVTNLAYAALFIAQVRALGVTIALDDFGAGASSFGHLKALAVDYLKIDGQFITNLLVDRLDEATVRCFVDVARVLGVKTVAEFVDSSELHARVGELGVDYAQGFILHRPEPLDDMLRTVAAQLAIHR